MTSSSPQDLSTLIARRRGIRGLRSILPASMVRAEILADVMAIARNVHFPIATRLAAIRTALKLKHHDLEELYRLIPSRVGRSTSHNPKTRSKADQRRQRLEFEIIKLRLRINDKLLAKHEQKARRRRSSPLHLKITGEAPAARANAVSQSPADFEPVTGESGAFSGEKTPFGKSFA